MADTKNTLGHALLQAFGLEDQRVKRLSLDIEAGDVPLLTVTVYPRDVSAQQIEAIATEYEIISRSELRDIRERISAALKAEPVAWRVRRRSEKFWGVSQHKPLDAMQDPHYEVRALVDAVDQQQAEPVQPIDAARDGR